MGYGFKSFTGTGATITQIDSDYSMQNMAPVSVGAAQSVLADYNNDIVLVNVVPSTGTFKVVLAWAVTNKLYFRVVTDTLPTSNPKTQTIAGALSYVKFSKTQGISASGTYGLKVFDASSNAVFDSRLHTTAGIPNITNVYQSNSFVGTSGLASASSRIASSISGVYVSLWPSLLSNSDTNGQPDANAIWVYPKGYLFANAHQTYGTGIYYFGGSVGFFGGYANQPNMTAILQAS